MPYKLEIPLDASEIKEARGGKVKVALVSGNEVLEAKTVSLGRTGKANATFELEEAPRSLRAVVGPAEVADQDLPGLQTLSAELSVKTLATDESLTARPIIIRPYYWRWWLIWCRKITIHGKLVGPDDCPVPGAEVCAYDVDWWFLWKSTQKLGCTTTADDGSFTIEFTWCCGWWPWWWWRLRTWQIDPSIAELVQPVLESDPELRLRAAGTQPSLEMFADVLANEGLTAPRSLARKPAALEQLREPILRRLPRSVELERLRIWPWWPWAPWRDCHPDLIFKATQECLGETRVVLDEGYGDVRWNYDTSQDVTLEANEEACCLPPPCEQEPCPDGKCLVVSEVCGNQIDLIGGNQVPPDPIETPEGYLNPGNGVYPAGAKTLDRPFAGIIPIDRVGKFEVGPAVVVDYYEILDDALNPLPNGAEVDFCRTWWTGVPGSLWKAEWFEFKHMPGLPAGHRVVETREHLAAGAGIDDWRWSQNRDLLLPLDTTRFADGTYRFKVRAWQEVGGVLTNPTVLPLCDFEQDAGFVLTFDNRPPITAVGHPASHNCGPIHVCTFEPDCHIKQVRVGGVVVGECGTVAGANGDLEIDFVVSDPNAHLSHYDIEAEWGVNHGHSLIHAVAGANLAPTNPADAIQVGPTYGDAVSPAQGALPPHWSGGNITLTVPAHLAFPVPCCYQLVLRVRKRTVVGGKSSGCRYGCNGNYPHRNRSKFTLGVGVCPPQIAVPHEPLIVEPELDRVPPGPGPGPGPGPLGGVATRLTRG